MLTALRRARHGWKTWAKARRRSDTPTPTCGRTLVPIAGDFGLLVRHALGVVLRAKPLDLIVVAGAGRRAAFPHGSGHSVPGPHGCAVYLARKALACASSGRSLSAWSASATSFA
jgi:hypothetical protein